MFSILNTFLYFFNLSNSIVALTNPPKISYILHEMEDPDYILEISSCKPNANPEEPQTKEAEISARQANGRRYISVLFACCNVYQRIYINKSHTAYEGKCPRCLRPVRVRIGSGGTEARFFTAT